MKIWQADFYRSPQQDAEEKTVWELFICESPSQIITELTCRQSEVSTNWLIEQLQKLNIELPEIIQVFRPQALNLFEVAGKELGIKIEPTRRTFALKQLLKQKYSDSLNYHPLALDKPPPMPLPENLWGKEWRFANLPAGELMEVFSKLPIPILEMPDFLSPLNLGIPSIIPIPGVIIYAGRQSMSLARWLQNSRPIALNYMPGVPDGLILESGLIDRWVVTTFEDPDVALAGKHYEQRKQASQGLHFLLIQPDDSGMTYTGFWLLQAA